MQIETYVHIEESKELYNLMKHFGELELVEKSPKTHTSYNEWEDDDFEYTEYIYTYNYKPHKGMELLARDLVIMAVDHDILN